MVKSYVDYATDNITVYQFCEHGCVYCWAWRIPLFKSRILRGRYDPVEEAKKYLKIRDQRVIVISFTSDPYPIDEYFVGITRDVLRVLSKAKQHKVLILTKNPIIPVVAEDLSIMRKHGNMWLGTTITTLDDDVARKIEPNAAVPSMRLRALKHAKKFGVKTWISIEPIIPYVTYPEDVVKVSKDFVDWYVLGAYNYYNKLRLPKVNRYIPDGGRFTRRELTAWYNLHVPRAIKLLKEYNKSFFVKKELKKYLGDLGYG